MNNPLISRVANYVRGMDIGIQGMAEFAPGVLGVHDTYGPKGEWDTYFDMTRWEAKEPQLWGELQVKNPDMEGVGVLEGMGTTQMMTSVYHLFRFAQRNLQPVNGKLRWHSEPKDISPSEYGAGAMVSASAGGEPLRVSNPGLLARAGQLLRIGGPPMFTPTQRTAMFLNGKDLDVERNKEELLAAFEGSGVHVIADYDPLQFGMRGNRHYFDLEEAFTGQVTIPDYIANRMDPATRQHIIQSMTAHSLGYSELAAKHRSEDMRNTPLLKITPDMDMRGTLEHNLSTVAGFASEGHLLSLYIYAHGSEDGFEIGFDDFMSYAQLFEMLDTVPGKKFVVLCACYSGNLVDFVKRHEHKDSYAVITSTGGELGTNWNDDEFHPLIAEAIAKGEPLSKIKLKSITVSGHTQSPQRFLGFNAKP